MRHENTDTKGSPWQFATQGKEGHVLVRTLSKCQIPHGLNIDKQSAYLQLKICMILCGSSMPVQAAKHAVLGFSSCGRECGLLIASVI